MTTPALSKLFTEAAITSPMRLTQAMIDHMMDAIQAGGDTTPVLSDPNNVVTMLLECFSSLLTSATNATQLTLQSLYPRRAMTMADLLRHMSDYDYIDVYSTPASSEVILYLDPQYLARNAVVVAGTDYRRATLPADTTVVIAGVPFGIHYPINIDINPTTRSCIAAWDTTVSNPLYTVAQTSLAQTTTEWGGLELLAITVPLHQFSCTTSISAVASVTGFSQILNYSQLFYAVRVFNYDGSNWNELAQTLSEYVYDPAVLTALVEVNPDAKRVGVSIPRIYFDTGMVGSKIKIMLYTCRGEVDMELSDAEINTVEHSITNDNAFSAVFENIPTIRFVPATRNITGGANALTFAELKERVVNRSLTTATLVTPPQVENYFQDLGFAVSRYRDGLTDRIYYASRRLEDTEGIPILAGSLPVRFTGELLDACAEHIVPGLDDTVVILPSALFSYDATLGYVTPLTDAQLEVAMGSEVTRAAKAAFFNAGTYLQSLYHVKVSMAHRYPVAYSYDLFHPSVDGIQFQAENTALSTQVQVRTASISHLEDGTGGYQVILKLSVSSDLTADVLDPANDLVIFIETENALGDAVHMLATYASRDGSYLYYTIDLATNYAITYDHEIRLTPFTDNYGNGTYDFPLTGDYTVVTLLATDVAVAIHGSTLINTSALPSIGAQRLNANAYEVYGSDYVHLCAQSITLTLGKYLDFIENRTRVVADSLIYTTYTEDQYATLPADEYERDSEGNLVYTILEGNLILTQTARQGDWLFGTRNWVDVEVTTTEGSTTATVATDHSLVAGMCVKAMAVPVGTKLATVSSDGLTLALTVPAESTGTNTMRIGYPTTLHAAGDTYLDANQNPVAVAARELEYRVNLTLVDAKLTISEQTEHDSYLFDLTDVLANYFDTLELAAAKLVEGTSLYFRPQQSVGVASFVDATGEVISHSLDISLGFRLYITAAAASDATVLAELRASVQNIVNEELDGGDINCVAIAARIVSELNDQVTNVDILGIDNNSAVQTLLKVESGTRPSLAQELVLLDDGTLGVERKLSITFVEV